MDVYVTAISNAILAITYSLLPAITAMGGAWFALAGSWTWYESTQGRSDVQPRQYLMQILIGGILLGFTGAGFAGGNVGGFLGASNLSGSSAGYSVARFQAGALSGDAQAQANATLSALMGLCAALGWVSQARGVIMANDLGRGRSDTSVWRILGYIIGGAILADMGNFIQAIDATLGTQIFG